MRISNAEFGKLMMIAVAIALVPVLVWLLFDVILIAVAAVVIAMLLRLGAEQFSRWLRFPDRIALGASILLVVAILAGAAYLFGTRISSELIDVLHRADSAQEEISTMLQGSGFGRLVLSHITSGTFSVAAFFGQIFTFSATALEAIIVAVIAGIYIAAEPSLYQNGLIKLFPPEHREHARETAEAIATALRLWLLGQLMQMAIIGLLSGFAAWLIGLSSPAALGLIAGIAEFIPYVGPILAAVPAVLVAATKDFSAIWWTIGAYVLIHQNEGNLLVPAIQRRMVLIPPAVMLLGIVSISFVFGFTAIIFAAPITVMLFVLIKKLYVRDTLGTSTALPGD
jgi:predicted PurR-regulated permease PerM